MPHPERDEPLYSGNAGHGSRPLDILDPQTSSTSLSTHPAASLRDFTSPSPLEKPSTISPVPSPFNSTTPPLGLAGHGSRGPQEGLDADHLRVEGVRDMIPKGEEEKGGKGKEERYIAKGERRGYGGFAGGDEYMKGKGERREGKKGGGGEKTG